MDLILALLGLTAAPILAYVIVNLTTRDSEPLYGIYAIPGRWFALKFHTMKLMLASARRKTPHAGRRAANPALMLTSTQKMCQLDLYSGIDDDPYGHNSFYVNGSDQTGETRLIVRVAIRPDDRRDVWFLLRLPGVGDLVLPRHPHCVITGVTGGGFTGAGLDCSVIEPLSKLSISYNGPCRIGIRKDWAVEDNRPLVHVRCSFTWSALSTYYDFSTDVHPCLAARNIAKEKWTRQLFGKLKAMKQSHFEQFGTVRGVVQVDDQEGQQVVLTGIRDRSSGPRRWLDMHSYVLNFIVLEYDYRLCGTDNGEIIPAVYVDLPLADLMEKTEDPPMRFAFSMQPAVGEKLCVEVIIDDVMHFNMDSDWTVTIREGLSRFVVNGVEGRGVCEILKRWVYHYKQKNV